MASKPPKLMLVCYKPPPELKPIDWEINPVERAQLVGELVRMGVITQALGKMIDSKTGDLKR